MSRPWRIEISCTHPNKKRSGGVYVHDSPPHAAALLFFHSSRASLRLPNEGMAVFFHLHGTFVCAPLLHRSVAHWGGRATGEDLAERDLSQEDLLWIQGELQKQHQFFTNAETLVQKAAEGSPSMSFFRYLFVQWQKWQCDKIFKNTFNSLVIFTVMFCQKTKQKHIFMYFFHSYNNALSKLILVC